MIACRTKLALLEYPSRSMSGSIFSKIFLGSVTLVMVVIFLFLTIYVYLHFSNVISII